MTLEPMNLTEAEANILSERLTSKLISLKKYTVIERANIEKVLKEQKFQYSGCTETQCAVEIGKMLNSNYIVIGTASKLGDTYSIDCRIIDVETVEAISSALFSTKGKIDDLLNGMDDLALDLYQIENKNKAYKQTKDLGSSESSDNSNAYHSSTEKGFNSPFPSLIKSIKSIKNLDRDKMYFTSSFALGREFSAYYHFRYKNYQFLFPLALEYQLDHNSQHEVELGLGFFLPFRKNQIIIDKADNSLRPISFSGNIWLKYRYVKPDKYSYKRYYDIDAILQFETSKIKSFGLRGEFGLSYNYLYQTGDNDYESIWDGDPYFEGISPIIQLQLLILSFGKNY